MKKTLIAALLCASAAAISAPSYAAFGLDSLTGNKASSSSAASVTAEGLVKNYVAGSKSVLTAQSYFAKALGLKDEADKLELKAKNLTDTASSDDLEEATKTQTESSKVIEEAMKANSGKMTKSAKSTYTKGLKSLAQGIVQYKGVANDVKNYKPSLTSFGGAASAAAYVVKSLPESSSNLIGSLKNAIDFARDNKISVPKDATDAI